MANAEQYARWIVENEDKKGTDEFETVANAYRAARQDLQIESKPKPSKDISFGERFKDVGAGLVSGAGALAQLPGQLSGLVGLTELDDTGLQGAGKRLQQYGQEMKSSGLKAREQERTENIREAEKTGQFAAAKTAFLETIKDPALLLSFLAEQAPQLVVPFGAARGAAALTGAKALGKGLAAEEAAAAAGQAGTRAAIGTGAVQQGADIGAGSYENIYAELIDKGADPSDAKQSALNLARAAGASGALISLLAQKLPGAKALEESLAGVPIAGTRQVVNGVSKMIPDSRLFNAARAGLGESLGEVAEETGGRFSQNLAMREVKPEQSLSEGLGEAAGMAAVGGVGMGGISGALQRQAPDQIPSPQIQPEQPQASPTATPSPLPLPPPAGLGLQLPSPDGMNVPVAPPVPDLNTPPVAAAPVPSTQEIPPEFFAALNDYDKGLPDDSVDVFARLQNRDRATPASIQQMQGITAKPDYDRLKTSSDFANGAPVVMSDVRIPDMQMGKTEVVTAADGRKIPVQYAVVEAGDLMTSHSADGLTNKSYGDMSQQGIRAVAGNGRIAGLQAAYGGNTAEPYRQSFMQDGQHGIDSSIVRSMESPVLVRIMPKSFVTPDIGDVSNVSGALRLNPVEMAVNDGNRFDINGINFKDDGSFDKDSLIQFVRAMPNEEQGELMDKNGMPNTKAIDRLNNAIFHKAYGSPSLIELYAQAADPEARLILQAMSRSASKAANLEGAGEYDIRKNIIDAAELAVNARRQGIKLKDYVNQGDIGMDPNTRAVLDMFAENSRSGKRMGELLSNLADAAVEQANAGEDMFGQKPKLSIEDIFKTLKQAPVEPVDLFNQPTETDQTPLQEEPTPPPAQNKPPESKKFNIPDKSRAQIDKELTGLDINQANQWLIDNAPNSVAKYIAEKIAARIKAMTDAGVPMTFKVLPKVTRSAQGTSTAMLVNGRYSVKVEINGINAKGSDGRPNPGTDYKTVMHEMLHAATQPQVWLMGALAKKSGASQSDLFKELSPLLLKIRRQISKDIKDGKSHPFLDIHKQWLASGQSNPQVKNVSELISYGLTEATFQDYLKTVQVAKNQSAFSKLVDLFRQLLNMDTQYQSALEELASVTEAGLSVPVPDIKAETRKAGFSVGRKLQDSSEKIPNPFGGKKEKGPTPTAAGAESLQKLKDMGRDNQEAEKGYAEKISGAWDNARDNPKATAEAAKAATSKFLDRLETWTFSSDAALNNRIRESIRNSTLSDEEKIGLMLNASLSQTVHSDAVASLFLQRGGIQYNEELHKWEGVENQSNFVKLSKQLDALAEKSGLTKQQAELIAHTAFEAKRLKSMIRFNDELADTIREIKQEAKARRAKSPVAANALNEKAQALSGNFKFIHLTNEQIQQGMDFFKIHPELNEIVDTWNGIRSNTVKTLVDTGLWSANEAEEMLSNADYVPFYREEQLEKNQGPKDFIRGLQVQAKEKRLKGSSRPVNDIFDNQVRWVQYSINRAVRNRSALALADTAVQVGAAKRVKSRKEGNNVVRVWRNGEEQFYDMDDPMFMEAFTGLEAIVIPSWKWASDLADVLRQSVVMYPLFSVAQVPQDSFAAMFSSGLKPQYALRIPILAVKEFIQTIRGKSKTFETLKNVGAVGVRDFTSAMVRMDAEIFAGLKAPPGVLGKIKYSLNHIAMSADNAVRQAVYEASIAQGVSRAEAMEKAFEVFNVRRKGSSKSLALAGQLIPFFNAYLAAQNVAYKTITGRGISPTDRQEAFKTLAATTASVMTLSLLYAMMNGDDEDYLKKPATVRDRLLMIPGTGGMSIPIRADLFSMPKIITEHMYLMMTDKGYEDGRKFRDSMAAALGSAVLGPTAVPQAIKPLVEVGINYDFFQGKPLIGTYQKKLDTERQFTDSTSELGKILGQTGLVSPIAADHLLRGMFGSVGGLIIYATNPILHSDPNSPRPSLSERDAIAALPGMGGFMTKSYESALKKDFYTLKEEVDKAANTLNDLKTRSPQEIEGFLAKEENLSRVGLQKSVNAIGERLSNIRKAITQTTNSSLPADEKQRQITILRNAEEEMLKGVDVKMLRQLGKL
jgi:hypothetical protein